MPIISLTASYALRILAYLARDPGDWVRGAGLIASDTGVPRAYAVRILHMLGRAGLVRTKPGCQGGYRLAHDPDQTSVLDVVAVIDGPESLERCLLGLGRCSGKRRCALHPYWSKERARIEQRFEDITIGLLASRNQTATRSDHRATDQERIEDC